jgi:pimeloyl-ACP methyl ester carboxylesterase
MPPAPNIVLVHGAWADGSCWSNVIERLQADDYKVTAPQLPETSLADDVARVRHVLTRQSGPTVLAGHSYGGQVITALGTDAPNVAVGGHPVHVTTLYLRCVTPGASTARTCSSCISASARLSKRRAPSPSNTGTTCSSSSSSSPAARYCDTTLAPP